MTAEETAVLAVLAWGAVGAAAGAGADHPHLIGDLSRQTGFPRRSVERAIQSLSLQGWAICSSTDGVWLTSDAAELRRTEEALRRRALHQLRRYSAVKRTRLRMERRPLTLWEVAS